MIHGKAGTYNNRGCRCTLCKAAWAAYLKPRQQAQRRAAGIPARPAIAPYGGRNDEAVDSALHVRIPMWIKAAVRERAEADGVTMATVIRKAVEAALEIES